MTGFQTPGNEDSVGSDSLPSWPTPYGRPSWWVTAEQRDQNAVEADSAAALRDAAASDRDLVASARDDAGAARERDAARSIGVAQQRLIRSDLDDAQRWAAGVAGVEEAKAAHAVSGSVESAAALEAAEAVFEDDLVHLIEVGLERREVREDLDRASQHLAAASAERAAAHQDRSGSAADRSAAADDRAAARTARHQAAIDRAREPDNH